MTRLYIAADAADARDILLQFFHMWKVKIHKLPTSFPQKQRVFPHSLHMWKSYQQDGYPQKVFHIFDEKQAKPQGSMWKTMWKVWKSFEEPAA